MSIFSLLRTLPERFQISNNYTFNLQDLLLPEFQLTVTEDACISATQMQMHIQDIQDADASRHNCHSSCIATR